MRIRDKIITAACRTANGFEWSSYRLKPDEIEYLTQQTEELPATADQDNASALPTGIQEKLEGDITVAMRTSELLMRTMELPAVDSEEIAEMVNFQVDKISPFPTEQLAVAHEVLECSEQSSLVLMVAARRDGIDSIGEAYKNEGVRIHSIDARVLGWLRLLQDEEKITDEGCGIYIIDDGIELMMVVTSNGKPIAFRTLHADMDDLNVLEELTYEIGYTLTMLDAEHDLPKPDGIQFWSVHKVAPPLRNKLAEKTGLNVESHDLAQLPPLSEGMIRRTLSDGQKIELIPQEWVDLEIRRELQKKALFSSGIILAIWLVAVLIIFTTFKVRDVQLANVKERADEIAPQARAALQNRQKLKALKVYTDRSHSSLECLLEVTKMLPPGDIEFVSFNYKKGKGVTLRGTSNDDDRVYDFFKTLGESKLFSRMKDQSVNTKTTKGVKRSVFSVTLELPVGEENK